MKDKRIVVNRLTIITRGGPFQARLDCEGGRLIFAHYKHGILSLYENDWRGEELMAFPLDFGDNIFDDSRLDVDEFKALLAGLIEWRDN